MKIITLLFAFFFSTEAFSQAAIIVEPYAGYNFGKYEINHTVGAEEDKAEGPGVGARVGTTINGVRASAEVMYSMLGLSGEGYPSKDAQHLIYGVHLGLSLGAGIQLFGGYFLRSELKIEKHNTDTNFTEETTFKGRAYKAGATIPIYEDLQLGIEYVKNDYDKVESNTLGTQSIKNTNYQDVDHSSVFVSLSYPLYLRGSKQ